MMPHIADKAENGGKPGDQAEAREECAGYELQDPLGQKIGSVERLFVNERGEPEYIRVKMGLLGLKSALIPVQFVEVHKEQRIIALQ
jgi:hypothetical protein